ncbi:MAG: SgcJ/EcaC family oxidoreductase [Chlamydiales bacterium]|nr:SgcJ/EcaC family oxidoreductase [Chlamydiales bacterium]
MKRYIVLGLFTVAAMLLSLSELRAADKQTASEDLAVRSTVDSIAPAWNTQNLDGLMALWSQEGDLVIPKGNWAKNRDEVRQLFKSFQQSRYKDSVIEQSSSSIRFVSPDVALVDLTATVAGPREENSRYSNPQQFHVFLVMVRENEKDWKIAAARFSGI